MRVFLHWQLQSCRYCVCLDDSKRNIVPQHDGNGSCAEEAAQGCGVVEFVAANYRTCMRGIARLRLTPLNNLCTPLR
jgi:hypothetical protein